MAHQLQTEEDGLPLELYAFLLDTGSRTIQLQYPQSSNMSMPHCRSFSSRLPALNERGYRQPAAHGRLRPDRHTLVRIPCGAAEIVQAGSGVMA